VPGVQQRASNFNAACCHRAPRGSPPQFAGRIASGHRAQARVTRLELPDRMHAPKNSKFEIRNSKFPSARMADTFQVRALLLRLRLEISDGGAPAAAVGRGVVEPADQRMAGKQALHAFALHSDSSTVDQAHFGKTLLVGGLEK